MNIPATVLKELGVEVLQNNTITDCDITTEFPQPFKKELPFFSVDLLLSAKNSMKDLYNKEEEYKVTKEELFSMRVFDDNSLNCGQFLLDNWRNVRLFKEDSSVRHLFDRYFVYNRRNHTIKLKRTNVCVEVENTNVLALKSIFSKSKFIPLIFIDDIDDLEFESAMLADVVDDIRYSRRVSEFISNSDWKPNMNKYYFLHHTDDRGWFLARDTSKDNLKDISNIELPSESMKFIDIKNNFGLMSGLQTYFSNSSYRVSDVVYYFVKADRASNSLWLKRDEEKSPRVTSNK